MQFFGFPVDMFGIDPMPLGTPGGEWVVSLPEYVVKGLRDSFSGQDVLIGPGNTFGLHSCKDGLIKDGIKDVFMRIAGISGRLIYLMRKP